MFLPIWIICVDIFQGFLLHGQKSIYFNSSNTVSVTRSGNFLDFGQIFKAFGNN